MDFESFWRTYEVAEVVAFNNEDSCKAKIMTHALKFYFRGIALDAYTAGYRAGMERAAEIYAHLRTINVMD